MTSFDVEAARFYAKTEDIPSLLAACDEIERLQAFVDLGRRVTEQADELSEQRIALNAEIKTLRKQLDACMKAAEAVPPSPQMFDRAQAAEIERLREALRRIASFEAPALGASDEAQIARAALEEKP